MSWYCDIAPDHPVHHAYHATEYGFPLEDGTALYERLCLEIFQAGLSWEIILKRRSALNDAFHGFDPDILATWGEDEQGVLLQDPRIIRNRRKVAAVVHNARVCVDLRDQYRSFSGWIAAHHPASLKEWVKIFRRVFVFMGPEVVNEFLMSTGWLPGAHRVTCPVFKTIKALSPPWMSVSLPSEGA